MKIIGILALMVLVIPCLIFSQDIQEIEVKDFSGGLVNSVSYSLMKENQATNLINYNITDVGWLERRPGMMDYLKAGDPVEHLLPYFGAGDTIYVIQSDTGAFFFDSASTSVNTIAICDGDSCLIVRYSGLYQHRRHLSYPYNFNVSTFNEKMIFAGTKSEMAIFNGSYFYPVRPVGAGQPKAIAIDSGGTMTGTFWYKVAFCDGADTSNFSAPSWPVTVEQGSVLLWDMADTVESGVSDMIIYRKDCDTCNYERLDTTMAPVAQFLDTFSTTGAGDTAIYAWGNTIWGQPAPFLAPGGMVVTVDSLTHTPNDTLGIGLQITMAGAYDTIYAGYSVLFEDTAGTYSYMSAPTFDFMTEQGGADSTDWNYKATLTRIPVPIDSGIVKKWLLRCINPNGDFTDDWGRELMPQAWSWFRLVELDKDSTTYTDSLPVRGYHIYSGSADTVNLYCQSTAPTTDSLYVTIGRITTVTLTSTDWFIVNGMACDDCYAGDSVITFKPISFTEHGSRGFAIGNPDEPHRIYYSEFGDFSTWPYDKTLAIPSKEGDWPVQLVTLGDRLIVFKQNSIYQITGLSFSNFKIEEVISGVGLTAPLSVASGVNEVYFAHSSGIYRFSRFGGIGKVPISIQIQNSLDSISSLLRVSGGMFGDEYWISVDTVTYIYSEVPVPHWKSYSFGLYDARLFGDDQDFSSTKYILIRENDSLYKWGYEDTSTTDAGVTFTALYQSIPFFDAGEIREHIMYVDLEGSGNVDSLKVTILDNHGIDSVLTKTVQVDFTDNKRDRMPVMKILTDCTVRIEDFGDTASYTLKGYVVGYKSWDTGRSF